MELAVKTFHNFEHSEAFCSLVGRPTWTLLDIICRKLIRNHRNDTHTVTAKRDISAHIKIMTVALMEKVK